MICYALLAALALLGLGDARSATEPSPVYHVPLTTKLISYQRNHNEPVRESTVFLVGTISMGTPRQEIDVLFDLGSMEMIVPSTNSTTNRCDLYHCFNGNASSTFKNTGKAVDEAYDVGDDIGIIAEDTIQVGDLVVTKQAFLNCYTMDDLETSPKAGFHGIIGMDYRDRQEEVIEQYSAPFLYNAVDQGVIDKKQFAILYPRGSKDGKLTIGGWDEDFVSEDKIVWLENAQVKDPPGPANYWGITGVNDISAEAHGKTIHGGPLKAGLLVDTGNPLFLAVTDKIYDAINEVFRNCGQDLDNPSPMKLSEVDEKLPTLTFDFQGHTFSLKPSQYVVTHDDDPSDVKEGYGLVDIDRYNAVIAPPGVGGIFLRNFHTFYDMENKRMGLVPIAESADN